MIPLHHRVLIPPVEAAVTTVVCEVKKYAAKFGENDKYFGGAACGIQINSCRVCGSREGAIKEMEDHLTHIQRCKRL